MLLLVAHIALAVARPVSRVARVPTVVRMATVAPPAATSVAAPPAVDMAVCPETAWGRTLDIAEAQRRVREAPRAQFPLEVQVAAAVGAAAGDAEAELAYFREHAAELRAAMLKNGAVLLRGFALTKTPEGFQQMYQALGLVPCLDPLHSVAARPMVSKGSAVYEAVNKESRKNFFIGMHNEFVGKRAPRSAAFVCFKPAEEGGEFLLGDGRQILAQLNPQLVKALYERQIRYSVMELPFFGWIDTLPQPLQPPLMGLIRALATAALNAKVDFDVELVWREQGYDGVRMLQARAPVQPPVVEHPVTGEPTWFCNVHSHSSALRKQREALYGAERFESGASQINKSDMYYGDGAELSAAELAELDKVTMDNVQFIKMSHGDVVLLDNYVTMHGRNVFEGTRKHAVTWFQ
ncbi:hypothetical protein KFE25_011679 [Diacronema lutheri]|uniref:TauD/TfdA-like domain-containing protein n=1 Tax=Diacronema lutheri TaxID=2081491 RepID=A0A7R9UQK5_DIALT|nr:hypothetical protein KFE25_011679 [Diacronema lutheri]